MENNKLIAEFMGYTFVNGVYESRKDEFHIDEMLYNTSWDWLMPVIHKIKDGSGQGIFMMEIGLPIEYVYNAVVEFIKEHNDEQ